MATTRRGNAVTPERLRAKLEADLEQGIIDDRLETYLPLDAYGPLQRHAEHLIKSLVGVTTTVRVVAPGAIERSQGKARRVIDKRPKA